MTNKKTLRERFEEFDRTHSTALGGFMTREYYKMKFGLEQEKMVLSSSSKTKKKYEMPL